MRYVKPISKARLTWVDMGLLDYLSMAISLLDSLTTILESLKGQQTTT